MPLKIATIIERIYNCVTEKYTWPDVLKECAKIIDVAAVAIVPIDPKAKDLSFSSLGPAEHREAYDDYFHIADPWYKLSPYKKFYENKLNLIGDFSDINFISNDEIARSAFYQDFLKKFDWGRTNVFIHKDPFSVCTKIATQRHYRQRNETPQEREIRNIISRHIVRALSFSEENKKLLFVQDGFLGLFQNITCGAALLSNDTSVLMMNDRFKALIGDAFTYIDQKLSFIDNRNMHSLSHILGEPLSAADTMPRDKIVAVNCATNKKILLKIIKLPNSDSKSSKVNKRSALLLLACRPGETTFDVSQALRSCNLTRSEARFAGYVGTGLPPKTAAELTGISEQYGRTKLKEIFRKLNVNSQSQLATFIGTLSPMGSNEKKQDPPAT
ncbi:MAG: hypothetical protein ABF791_03730 [Acetobacter sp.]|uniref:helix-turn-helix transcriptional regulator n=1 Tax=Acetobacter sp. TaxID=440 RepID=UPI0039EA84A4